MVHRQFPKQKGLAFLVVTLEKRCHAPQVVDEVGILCRETLAFENQDEGIFVERHFVAGRDARAKAEQGAGLHRLPPTLAA